MHICESKANRGLLGSPVKTCGFAAIMTLRLLLCLALFYAAQSRGHHLKKNEDAPDEPASASGEHATGEKRLESSAQTSPRWGARQVECRRKSARIYLKRVLPPHPRGAAAAVL